jgi:hypothetical protein
MKKSETEFPETQLKEVETTLESKNVTETKIEDVVKEALLSKIIKDLENCVDPNRIKTYSEIYNNLK